MLSKSLHNLYPEEESRHLRVWKGLRETPLDPPFFVVHVAE